MTWQRGEPVCLDLIALLLGKAGLELRNSSKFAIKVNAFIVQRRQYFLGKRRIVSSEKTES